MYLSFRKLGSNYSSTNKLNVESTFIKISIVAAGLFLLLFLAGCKKERQLDYEGITIMSITSLVPPQYSLGDSLIFTFGYEGSSRINSIDVSLRRHPFREEMNSETLIFESFYPGTNNALITVKWKLVDSIGATPDGYVDEIHFKTESKTLSGDYWNYTINVNK